MKGEPYEGWPKGVESMFGERKFDGFRLQVVLRDGTSECYCSDPKPVGWAPNVQHIVDELIELGFENCLVDGEVRGANWNRTGIVKSGWSAKNGWKHPGDERMAEITSEIKFYAFDWVDITKLHYVANPRAKTPQVCFAMPLVERRAVLESYLRSGGAHYKDIVRLSEQRVVTCDADVDELLEDWAPPGSGCDGVMLKHPKSIYGFYKGKAWLKAKKVHTFEVRVIGCEEGEGKYAGTLGAFICVDAKGQEMRVGSFECPDAKRHEMWARRAFMNDSIIEVRASDDDVAKAARHAVFLRERDERSSL